MEGLAGRTALVTGASRGIGRAIATRLGAQGAKVIVNFASNADAADEVVQTIKRAGSQALAVQADMADPAAIVRLFDQAESGMGGVDIVVNNAGALAFGLIAELPLADLDRALALNARGNFTSLQQAARRVRDGGRIISISTGGTASPAAGTGAYAATKSVVEQLSFALAQELGPRRITVNVVRPGLTRTAGLVLDQQTIEAMVARTPLGRLGEPEDVAAVVAFLASEDAHWLTGQALHAAGGLI